MGGYGSQGSGENLYTSYKRYKTGLERAAGLAYSFIVRTDDYKDIEVLIAKGCILKDIMPSTRSFADGSTGRDMYIMECDVLPRRQPNAKVRSDKGKTHNRGKKKLPFYVWPRVDMGSVSFADRQKDIDRTAADIKRFEEIEEERILLEKHENLPHIIQRRKDQRRDKQTEYRRRNRSKYNESRREYARKKRAEGTFKEHQGIIDKRNNRFAAIPIDLICQLCEKKKLKNKQFVSVQFADGLHAICRICFEHLKNNYFDRDVKRLREFLVCCKYDELKSIEERIKS